MLSPLSCQLSTQLLSYCLMIHCTSYVHFVPIASNYSDIERQIQWCEEHLEEAKKISDRATVFVHDFLFHFQSEKDNAEVRFRVMERYAELFG